MTDYKWEFKQKIQQKETFLLYLRERDRVVNSTEWESDDELQYRKKQEQLETDNVEVNTFQTTVSIPVYDRRENAVSPIFISNFQFFI